MVPLPGIFFYKRARLLLLTLLILPQEQENQRVVMKELNKKEHTLHLSSHQLHKLQITISHQGKEIPEAFHLEQEV